MASVEVYSYTTPPNIINMQEGTTSGSFGIGDLVKGDTSGQVVIGTAAAFFGIARKGYTGTAGTIIPVELLSPDILYVMRAASSTTTAQANVGEEFAVTFTASAHTVAVNTTSGNDGIVYQLHPTDGVKAGGRYIVKFLPTVIGSTAA